MRDRKGFSLIELMAAASLAGMVLVLALPFLLLGKHTASLAAGAAAVSLEGDAIFEYVAGELKEASCIRLEDVDGGRPAGGEWHAIYVGDEDTEAGKGLQCWKGDPSKFDFSGEPLFGQETAAQLELGLHVQITGPHGIFLSVAFLKEGQVLYEREELIWSVMPASSSNAGRREGKSSPVREEKGLVIWYQKEES